MAQNLLCLVMDKLPHWWQTKYIGLYKQSKHGLLSPPPSCTKDTNGLFALLFSLGFVQLGLYCDKLAR